MPDGTLAYTRDGTFQTNAEGQLVTLTGDVVQPGITIPQGAQSVTIGNDGTVTVLLPNESTPTQVGQLQLGLHQPPACSESGHSWCVDSP